MTVCMTKTGLFEPKYLFFYFLHQITKPVTWKVSKVKRQLHLMLFCTGYDCPAVRECVDQRVDIVGFNEMVGCQIIKWAGLLQQICRGINKGGTCRKRDSRLCKLACQVAKMITSSISNWSLWTVNCSWTESPCCLLFSFHMVTHQLNFRLWFWLAPWKCLIVFLMLARGLHGTLTHPPTHTELLTQTSVIINAHQKTYSVWR